MDSGLGDIVRTAGQDGPALTGLIVRRPEIGPETKRRGGGPEPPPRSAREDASRLDAAAVPEEAHRDHQAVLGDDAPVRVGELTALRGSGLRVALVTEIGPGRASDVDIVPA